MSIKIHHRENQPPPEKPALIHMEKLLVVGNSAVVADGPKRGDVIVSSRVDEDYRLSHSGMSHMFGGKDTPPEPKWFYTKFTYYRVEDVSKPDGVCHGHSLLTLKELG